MKQPKYLFGALVGVAYFYFFFIRPRGVTGPRAMPGGGAALPTLSGETLVVIIGVAALALFLVALISWFIPRQAALAFSEAEIAFLFPAPVSRRMLIHYRILSSQFRLVFTAIIFTLVFRRGITVTHALGWWVILRHVESAFHGLVVRHHAIAESNADASAAAEHASHRRRPRCDCGRHVGLVHDHSTNVG